MMQLGFTRVWTYLINISAESVVFLVFEYGLKGARGALLWRKDPGRVLYFK